MKKYKYMIWTLLLVISASCESLHDDPEQKIPLGFDEVKLKGIEGCMDYYRVPGCSWVVIKDTGMISGSAGVIYDGSNHEIETSDHFQVGSLGKSFTSLMAARCVEEGLLSWDSKIFDVLPAWKEEAQSDYEGLTLADLLSHRTNLQPLNTHETHLDKRTGKLVYEDMPEFTGTDLERRRAYCRYALSLPPVSSEGVNYGNAGYSIAGCMMEEVTGRPWEELALSLAADLGMEIGFERPNRDDPFQPWGHLRTKRNQLEPISETENKVYNDPIASPAGNIHVSVLDFSKYVKQFMNGLHGEDGVVPGEQFRYLLGARKPYSMGWYNDFTTDSIYYHYGSEQTFYCHMMIFDNLDAAIIIFTNAPGIEDTLNFLNDTRNFLKEKYIYGTIE